MEKIVLCLGSNCGDREGNVAQAVGWLRNKLHDAVDSGIYETPAFGHVGAPYMNAVVIGDYPLEDVALLDRACKTYEFTHGRDAEARDFGLVPIDIDIVKAGSRIMRPADFACEFFRIGYRRICNVPD